MPKRKNSSLPLSWPRIACNLHRLRLLGAEEEGLRKSKLATTCQIGRYASLRSRHSVHCRLTRLATCLRDASSQRILKIKREKYFTPGEGEEKVIKAKLETFDARPSPSKTSKKATKSKLASSTEASSNQAASAVSPGKAPASPARKALTNISNSPRANRTAPAVEAVIANTLAGDAGVEQESYLPTPQTTERSTAPAAPASSSISPPTSVAGTGLTGTSTRKSTYKPLVPSVRPGSSEMPLPATLPTSQAELPSFPAAAPANVAQGQLQQERFEGDSGANPVRKRTAIEAELDDDPAPLKKHASFQKPNSRKASIATAIRARDERDDMEAAFGDDDDIDMDEVDESATQYSTEVRK